MNLRHILCLSAAAAMAAGASISPAAAKSLNGFTIIKFSGDRGWTAECRFDRPDKSPVTKRARGSASVVTLSARGAAGGSCDYTGPRDGAVQVRFTDENDEERCPFTRIDGACIGVISAGAEGSFAF